MNLTHYRILFCIFGLLFCFQNCGIRSAYYKYLVRNQERNYESYNYIEIKNRTLTWDDFKGNPNKGSMSSEIFWDIFYYPDSIVYYGKSYIHPGIKIWCGFSEKSYVIPAFKSDYLLNHMQGHFNLVKIYADSMKILLPKLNPLRKDNWNIRVDSLKDAVIKKCKSLEKKYDKETDFAKKKEVQLIWDSFIGKRMNTIVE